MTVRRPDSGSTTERPRRRCGLACALLLLGSVLDIAGCRDNAPAKPQDNDATSPEEDDGAPAPEAAAMEKLGALGYLDFSPEEADTSRLGVVHNDRERSYPGYNLYTDPGLATSFLIDENGNVIRSWTYQPSGRWHHGEILANGDFLIPARNPVRGGYLLRMTWEGQVLWKRNINAHHDFEVTPRGQILTLTTNPMRRRPDGLRIYDTPLTLLSHDGRIIEKLSLYELITRRPDLLELRFDLNTGKGDANDPDLLHANSIEWMHHKHLESKHRIYASTNVIVTIRHQNAIVIINWDAKELVWAWGPGEILGPHDAAVLENGNILLLDNGLRRGWSRAVELDPLARKIVWEYKAPEPTDFYTPGRGSAQRLPNGNTLITNSRSGRVFEVTRAGEIVWEFLSPHLNDKGHRAAIVRMKRYERSYIDRILQARRPAADPPQP